jgi:hypothetical protein
MMRWLHWIVVGMVTLAVVGCASALSTPAAVPATTADRGKTLEAQTFGQPRPGLTPEPFLPDILAEDSHDGLRRRSPAVWRSSGRH